MTRLMVKLIFFSILLTPIILFSTSDSTKQSDNSLILNPRFSGFQVEATSLVLVNEFGGLLDLDLYSSQNKYDNLGVRFSIEYYDLVQLDFGGSGSDESRINYNLYLRHTIKGSVFWFSFLFGASIQRFTDEYRSETYFVPRVGFELKYNFTKYKIGLLFKGAKSFIEDGGYLGLGLSLGFYSY